MAKRGGLSLSVKLILTTTLLMVVIVAGVGLLSVSSVSKAFDEATTRQNAEFRRSRDLLGAAGAPLFASAVTSMLVQRGQDDLILKLTEDTVAKDTRSAPADMGGGTDYGLRLAFVLDHEGRVVAHCFEAGKLACVDGGHRPLTLELGQLAVNTWRAVMTGWLEASAKRDSSALVATEVEGGGERYRVYALPVMNGIAPTPALALATPAPPERLGYVVLAYDLAPVERYAAHAAARKTRATREAVLYMVVVGALFALIGGVLAIFQGLSISRPIKQLAWKADRIARGDLEARVDITSNDEIGVLGENFNFMADQLAVLLAQTSEKARLDQELEVAKAIQETLVPAPARVERGFVTFAGYYQPAEQTGGDWWTYADLTDGKTLIVIGDVTGHGVPSAMITAAAKAACDVARHVEPNLTVTRLLEIMNHAIYTSAGRRFAMTCFASILDPAARTITYANAGHNFPYLFRANDPKGEFGSLMTRGNRLGDDPGSRYEAKTTELQPGDRIVWYTDGLVECANAAGEAYGEKRFRASVKRAATLDPAEMRDAIVADAAAFFGDTRHADDITMVVGRIQ